MSLSGDRPSSDEKRPLENRSDAADDVDPAVTDPVNRTTSVVSKEGTIVNASGHRDQLQRQYGLWSICGLALTIDNAWVAFGGSLSVAVLNGGPPGILYEYIVACVYYGLIGASIAELASAIPSSGGVYHWASITPGPRYGRIIGFFTGSLNFFGEQRNVSGGSCRTAAEMCEQVGSLTWPALPPSPRTWSSSKPSPCTQGRSAVTGVSRRSHARDSLYQHCLLIMLTGDDIECLANPLILAL